MGEFDLIERYFKRPARQADVGIGDDCAIWTPRAGQQLAISTDMLVEGRHFLSTVAPEKLGHKARLGPFGFPVRFGQFQGIFFLSV